MATNEPLNTRTWCGRYPTGHVSLELSYTAHGDGVTRVAIVKHATNVAYEVSTPFKVPIAVMLDADQLRELSADAAARADVLDGRT
jgi:hypothetical protein